MDQTHELDDDTTLERIHGVVVWLQQGLSGPPWTYPMGLDNVLLVSHELLSEAAQRIPSLGILLADVIEPLGSVADERVYVPPAYLAGLGGRIESLYPAWRLLLDKPRLIHPEVRRLAAAELARALLHAKSSRRPKSTQSFRFGRRLLKVKTLAGEELRKELRRLDKLAQRIEGDLAALSDCRKQTLRGFAFRNEVAAHVQGLLHPKNVERRQQRTAKMLASEEVVVVAHDLRRRTESGDDLALAVVISFCSPLQLNMIVDLPLLTGEDGDWIAVLDLAAGAVCLDLSSVLVNQAAGNQHSECATQIYRFHLPYFATQQLRARNQVHPDALTVGDLLGMESTPSARAKLDYGNLSNSPSIARFLNSKSVICDVAGLNRGDAAFSLGDFGQLGEPLHYYLTLRPHIVQDNATKVHGHLSWAEAAAEVPGASRFVETLPATGSRSTPTQAAIIAVDSYFIAQLKEARVGPNSGWPGLAKHHNAYSRAVAHRIGFHLAARRKHHLCLYADLLSRKYALGFHPDKRTGPLAGMAPVVISPQLSLQLDLYRGHLAALERRAERRAPSDVVKALKERIAAIDDEQHVNLLFEIKGPELRDFGMGELAAVHPEIQLDGDFRRHFIASAAHRSGLSAEQIEFLLRHHVAGYSPYDALSTKSVYGLARPVGEFIDGCLRDLNMLPLVGLSSSIA